MDRLSVITGRRTQVQLRRARPQVLEMEDVLFHHNSAVLMPSSPEGLSSVDGSEDDLVDWEDIDIMIRQGAVTGLAVLALVYREFEINPDLQMVIAGHTDTSGTAKYNFELAKLRADNVLYLIEGSRTEWAELCYGKHKVEDYQQVMKYFHNRHPDWNCDPGKLDDTWGDNTDGATENFFAANRLPDDTITRVRRDGRKRWPVEAWEKVFDLYIEEVRGMLHITEEELEQRRFDLDWVDYTKKSVGCGESFPVDDAERDSYRSQENRRVEIFLFSLREAPLFMDCPDRDSSVHTTDECPLRNRHHIRPIYIDPTDLTAIAYHLQFRYFDRMKQSWEDVPDGLTIGAFEIVGSRRREVRSTTTYVDGKYVVRVQDNPARDGLYFEFNTTDRKWVFTRSDTATPEIVTETADAVARKAWDERIKYYDLPQRWSSRNYWVREAEDSDDGQRFEEAMDDRDLKPYGDETTTADEPLIFSLDDIVLVDGDGRQSIRDKNAGGGALALSADSRLTLFYLDADDDYQLKIFDPIESHPYFSDIEFDANLITEFTLDKIPRLIVFAGDMYSIWDKRSERVSGFRYSRGHVIGARAAVLNDEDYHFGESVHVTFANGNPPYDYVQKNCGNYELHFLDKCGVFNNKPLSHLIIYWCCRFRAHPSKPPTDANWRDNFERNCMTASMERSNRPYLLEKATAGNDILIRPFHFFEAKLDGRGGEHKALVDISRESGAWMMPTTAKFEQRAYQPIHGYYSGIEPEDGDAKQDVDGGTYDPFTANHEFGHATGCFDDYMYSLKDGDDTYHGVPGFNQPYTAEGGPYSKDLLARMFHNRSPRMRNIWHFVNWVNDRSAVELNDFTGAARFKLTYTFNQPTGGARTIELDLRENRCRDTCSPSCRTNNYVIRTGQEGKADLLLYKTGGETTYTLDSNHEFTAILVVKTKLCMDFRSGVWNWLRGRRWNKRRRQNWMVQHLKLPIDRLNRYYLHCDDANNEFHKTLLLFNPFFCLDSPPSGQTAHFEIEVTYNNSGDFETDGDEIEVGNNVDHDRILRYIYGKTGGGAFTANDFSRIAEWIGRPDIANGTFSVRSR